MMLVDMAVLAYYNVLRVQGWVGNMALHVEHEFFGQASPAAKFGQQYGRVEGLLSRTGSGGSGNSFSPCLIGRTR